MYYKFFNVSINNQFEFENSYMSSSFTDKSRFHRYTIILFEMLLNNSTKFIMCEPFKYHKILKYNRHKKIYNGIEIFLKPTLGGRIITVICIWTVFNFCDKCIINSVYNWLLCQDGSFLMCRKITSLNLRLFSDLRMHNSACLKFLACCMLSQSFLPGYMYVALSFHIYILFHNKFSAAF